MKSKPQKIKMDKALLEERKKFKQQFMSVHSSGSSSSSKKPSESGPSSSSDKKKNEKEKKSSSSAQEKLNLAHIKQMGGGSQFKFGVLTKIVRHMKSRHLEGDILKNYVKSSFLIKTYLFYFRRRSTLDSFRNFG